jgi:homopolymeric O-antigen transport system permease protein
MFHSAIHAGRPDQLTRPALLDVVALLTRHKQLTWEMAKREITEKYTGQLFGVFWAIGHPLMLMLVYLFVFGVIFHVSIGGTADMPRDYPTYLLAGLIPWLSFQETMSKSTTVIVNNANLVKQVVFPLEVLPAKGVIATIVTEAIFLTLLMIYVLARQHSLPAFYMLLPALLALQIAAMIGISYVLSAVGVYVRDTKDFVQVFLVVGVYLIPAFYLPAAVPAQFRLLLYANPFSYLIWCFQDVLYYGRFEHPWAWPVFLLWAIVSFIAGSSIFRRLKLMFGNVL